MNHFVLVYSPQFRVWYFYFFPFLTAVVRSLGSYSTTKSRRIPLGYALHVACLQLSHPKKKSTNRVCISFELDIYLLEASDVDEISPLLRRFRIVTTRWIYTDRIWDITFCDSLRTPIPFLTPPYISFELYVLELTYICTYVYEKILVRISFFRLKILTKYIVVILFDYWN